MVTVYVFIDGGGGVSRAQRAAPLHTWHFELGLIASFPGLISGYQRGMPLEGHVRAMEFAVVIQIHEERSIEDQGTYIIERWADLISGPDLAWR